MPSLLKYMGYSIYFWANENNEPLHVHISKGAPSANATKVWISSTGVPVLCHNKSRIQKSDLSRIMALIQANCFMINNSWVRVFGSVSYYC